MSKLAENGPKMIAALEKVKEVLELYVDHLKKHAESMLSAHEMSTANAKYQEAFVARSVEIYNEMMAKVKAAEEATK